MKKTSHKERIEQHLFEFGTITPMEALREYGCFRLAPRIKELREDFEIETENVPYINKLGDRVYHAKYRLIRA